MTDWNVKPPAGTVITAARDGRLSHQPSARRFVRRAQSPARREARTPTGCRARHRDGKSYPAGTWYVGASVDARGSSRRSPRSSASAPTRPPRRVPAAALKLRRPRVGLWDQYGGSMDSGWARWILEQYQFSVREGVPADARRRQSQREVRRAGVRRGRHSRPSAPAPGAAQPARCRHPGRVSGRCFGRMTAERTMPELRRFIENGGTVITIGASSTNLARAPEAADRGSSRRGRQAAARRRSSTRRGRCSPRASTSTHPRRARAEGANGHVLRQQPGLQAGRRRGGTGRQGARLVRHAPRRSRAAGRGASSISQNGVAVDRSAAREGARAALRAGDHQARAAARRRSSFCSTGSITE